jgi:DNA polymerase III alpha subunit
VVRAGGLYVMRQQPPTAKGHVFLTLEDEFGFINVIIRPQVFPSVRETLRGASVLVVTGRVQHRDGVTNLLLTGATRFDLSV